MKRSLYRYEFSWSWRLTPWFVWGEFRLNTAGFSMFSDGLPYFVYKLGPFVVKEFLKKNI